MNAPAPPPVERLLTASIPVSLVLTLASSLLYATRGWDDPGAAVLYVLGGAVGGIVVLRLLAFLDHSPRLAAAVLMVGMLGVAGVVGYGFNTIAVGLGGVDLIDESGAATILKVLGVCWPLALFLCGIALLRGRAPLPVVPASSWRHCCSRSRGSPTPAGWRWPSTWYCSAA